MYIVSKTFKLTTSLFKNKITAPKQKIVTKFSTFLGYSQLFDSEIILLTIILCKLVSNINSKLVNFILNSKDDYSANFEYIIENDPW